MLKFIWDKAIDMPPIWLLAFMALVWGQVSVWNPLGFASPVATTIGRSIIGAGLVLILIAAFMFWRHKTTIVPRNIPKAMISSGPYGLSRNPIYLADAIVLFGVCISNGSLIGLILVPIFTLVIQRRFIIGEEAGLQSEFGGAFTTYRENTRRWI